MEILEDKLDRQIYWVLRELRMITLNPLKSKFGYRFSFGQIPEMKSPSFIDQRKILKMLYQWNVIKIAHVFDESMLPCVIDKGITFFFVRAEKFDTYFWGLQEKLIYSEAHLDTLEKGAELEIIMSDGFLYMLSAFDHLRINEVELRHDGIPRRIFEYLINEAQGRLITTDMLKEELRIGIARPLSQIAIKAGFKKHLKEHFMVVCEKNALQLKPKVNLTVKATQEIINQLKQEKFNFIPTPTNTVKN